MTKYLGVRFETKYGWLEVIEDNGVGQDGGQI